MEKIVLSIVLFTIGVWVLITQFNNMPPKPKKVVQPPPTQIGPGPPMNTSMEYGDRVAQDYNKIYNDAMANRGYAENPYDQKPHTVYADPTQYPPAAHIQQPEYIGPTEAMPNYETPMGYDFSDGMYSPYI